MPGTPKRAPWPLARAWPWVAVPAAGALWAARYLRHSYFFYDEWSMIDRSVHLSAGPGLMSPFNGHLLMLQYLLYRAQVSWFGLDDHVFICVVFLCALVAFHASLAALFRASGLSRISSLLLGGLLTYLGAASQNFIFAIQTSPLLSPAACFAASALALARPPSPGRSLLVGALMLASVGLDSGMALLGLSFAVVVVALAWRRSAVLVVLPALLALGAWCATADLAPQFPAPLGPRAAFALHLLLRGLGCLVGRGELAGAAILLLSAAGIGYGLRRGHVTGNARIVLCAGTVATGVVTAAMAQSRAGLPGFNFIDFNRYLQNVAVPAALAIVPALAATARGALAQRPRLAPLAAAPHAALVLPLLTLAASLLGLRPLRAYAPGFESWNLGSRRGVRQALLTIRDGCPSGAAPDPGRAPLGDFGPQVNISLLRELFQRGAFDLLIATPLAPDPIVVDRICAPPARPASAR
jgi:hypothetical protein